MHDFKYAGILFVLLVAACESKPAGPLPDTFPRGPATGYYDTVNATDAMTLRATLHAIIKDHTRFEFTDKSTDLWNILDLADQVPDDPASVVDVYRNRVFAKEGGSNPFYHREHVWPNAMGFPDNDDGNVPYTDAHNLMIADGEYNIKRGNRYFDTCPATCEEFVTDKVGDSGGGQGTYPGNSNWASGTSSAGTWEVWKDRRGDIARALFYMDVRYEGDESGIDGRREPNLVLTDDPALIVPVTTNQMLAHMGLLQALLAWHQEDRVSAAELRRNDAVASLQGNRNPFIDHPEYADCLFGGACNLPPPPRLPWVNEFHYDNTGTDANERIEVAGVAGTDLAGYTLVLYNGSGGAVYDTIQLSGTIPDQGGGGGALSFDAMDLQNDTDGFALVAPDSTVVEFLSYEGMFVAADGPAMGMTSTDVLVAEPSGGSDVESLQLTGSGCSAAEFTWTGPVARTMDAINTGQTLTCTP